MKRCKIVSTLLVMIIVQSTMLLFNIVNEVSAYTPGINAWGNATINLEYGVSYNNVYVNSSKWLGLGPFYLYYPTYTSGGVGGNANEFSWDGPYQVSGYSVRVTDIANSAIIYTGGVPIAFNRSGMWIFDSDSTHAGDTPTSYAGFLWVNTSTKYTIDKVPNFYYGSSGSVTITVHTGNDTGCMIAIMDPDNHTIYHKWRATGITEAIGKDNFTSIGTYIVKAYRDSDTQNSTYYYPDEYYAGGGITENYSTIYGSDYTGNFPVHPSATPEYYSYFDMGPWDPPEKNATERTFRVLIGTPPSANFTYTIDELAVSFNASSSYDPDGNITTWLWDFGDGVEGAGEIITHDYHTSGTYNVTLTVVDDDGVEDSVTKNISVEKYQTGFIIGKITNVIIQEDCIMFEAINTWVFTFAPFSFNYYLSNEQLTISNEYIGRMILFTQDCYIIALCKILN